jgi:Flp pilus assembly protein TadB
MKELFPLLTCWIAGVIFLVILKLDQMEVILSLSVVLVCVLVVYIQWLRSQLKQQKRKTEINYRRLCHSIELLRKKPKP